MENLIITTICHSDINIFNELVKLASKYDCQVQFSHWHSLGLDNVISLQVVGNWNSIAKLETTLPTFAKQLKTELLFRRLHQETANRYHLPYQIEIIAVNQVGIVYEISEFFNAQEVYIKDIKIETITHQQTPILTVDMQIDIPANSNIADFREHFLIFW